MTPSVAVRCATLCLLLLGTTQTALAASEGEACGRFGIWQEHCDEGLRCDVHRTGKFFRIGVCVPATCEYEGASYEVGESFPAADGCNTCGCDEDGQVFCTERACICNFEDPNRSYTGRDAETCATIRFICAPGWQPFFDACGCGCERSCHVGGCSGQLCVAPGEPDITTCEWRDEYACYADATCELQEDGSCGWTPTEELAACLAEAGSTD